MDNIEEIKKLLDEIKGSIETIKDYLREERVNSKEMQDTMFDTWLNQYQPQPKVNFTQEAQDAWYNECALPPTQGCNIYNEDGTLMKVYLPKN